MKAKILCTILTAFLLLCFTANAEENRRISVAVEFNDHAAGAYVAMEKGFYEAEGLSIKTYESYATGMALSGALSRGDVDAAYICLVPAINAFANAGVPIKVVSGTHLYGYGILVSPDKIQTLKDLESEGVRIGCMREGSVVDVLLRRTIKKYGLDKEKILSKTRRMSPAKALRAISTKQLDAAFLPEHWASMAEQQGFKMLHSAKDVWPGMTGSVLVVTEDLIRKNPQTVKKLVQATGRATKWINKNPESSANIISSYLCFENNKASLQDTIGNPDELKINPQLISRSMEKLEYTTSLNKTVIQDIIDYMAGLGYIKNAFNAEKIVDRQFLEQL